MRTIVGLGNPGAEHEGSRHNVGFLVIAGLAREHRIRLSAGPGDFMSGVGSVAGTRALLVMPLTYMNRSGLAIAQILERGECEVDELLVVCDDINLQLGQLRLRPSGSAGGHNGLASIISTLGREDFARLRVGVGPPGADVDLADYVLDRFSDDESDVVEEMLSRSRAAVRELLTKGMSDTQTAFNRRPDGSGDLEK